MIEVGLWRNFKWTYILMPAEGAAVLWAPTAKALNLSVENWEKNGK